MTNLSQQRQQKEMNDVQIQLALKATRVGAWELDLRTSRLVCTPQARMLWGFPPDVPLSIQDLLARVHPDDRERVARIFDKDHFDLQEGFEYRVIWPDGSLHWLSGGGQAIRDKQGRLVRQIGIVVEITDRKRAEEVQEQRRLFRRLLDAQHSVAMFDLAKTLSEQEYQLLVKAVQEALVTASPSDSIGLRQRLEELQLHWRNLQERPQHVEERESVFVRDKPS